LICAEKTAKTFKQCIMGYNSRRLYGAEAFFQIISESVAHGWREIQQLENGRQIRDFWRCFRISLTVNDLRF